MALIWADVSSPGHAATDRPMRTALKYSTSKSISNSDKGGECGRRGWWTSASAYVLRPSTVGSVFQDLSRERGTRTELRSDRGRTRITSVSLVDFLIRVYYEYKGFIYSTEM
jgi:hypothetical protein